MIKQVIKRDGRVVPYDFEKIKAAICRGIMDVEKIPVKWEELSTTDNVFAQLAYYRAGIIGKQVEDKIVKSGDDPIHIERIQDIIEQTLIENWMVDTAEVYMLYREGKTKIRNRELIPEQFCPHGMLLDKFKEVYKWNIDHDCDTVNKVNDWVRGKDGKKMEELIKLSSERYEKEVDYAADLILQRLNEIKIVIVAGPSSSGKTTTTIKIEERLKKHGVSFRTLNLDDYFHDNEKQPHDEYGDIDYEMPEALDYELINKHLEMLMDGKPIDKPKYNFKTGKREKETERFELLKDEILLLDCLHGLYSRMTQSVPKQMKFKLYIEQMNVIRNIQNQFTKWTDVRLLRRMIRDERCRNHPIKETLKHWRYVRKGELKHIIPYVKTVDVVINGGVPYELPVLKYVIGNRFPDDNTLEEFKNIGLMDPYIRGKRVLHLLNTVDPYENLDAIPAKAHIREFIGGSYYEIPHND